MTQIVHQERRLVPGQRIGVLGGGQLGSFFAIAAKQMGYEVAIWDTDPLAPGRLWADQFFVAPFGDPLTCQAFVKEARAATYEWDNIPASLISAIESKVGVYPGSLILHLLQNRISQKERLVQLGFPVTPFRGIKRMSDLVPACSDLGTPAILKTATSGYDGQGQWTLVNKWAITEIVKSFENCPDPETGFLLEKWVPYLKELSVLVVRDGAEGCYTYPVAENHHEQGILRISFVPAQVTASIAQRACTLSRDVVTALEGVGVFCVELFLLADGQLWINEIAPRPHNSGHYTMDVCTVSQFEQQVRVVCGLPVVEPTLFRPAAMVNILGDEIDLFKSPKQMHPFFAIPNLRVYHYRKQMTKRNRKMGHITLTGLNADDVRREGELVLGMLRHCSESHRDSSLC